MLSGVIVIGIAFPVVGVRMLGFTVLGIKKGSIAAWIMATYLGKVTCRSACAIMQSIGALGLSGWKLLFVNVGLSVMVLVILRR